MTPLRRRILLNAAKLFDLEVTICCFLLAASLVAYETPAVSFTRFLSMRVKVQNFAVFTGYLLAWHALYLSFDFYESRRFASRAGEIVDIFKATGLASVGLFVSGALLHIKLITPAFLLMFWLSTSASLAVSRIAVRYLLSGVRKRGRNLRQILIVGTNRRAVNLARRIEARPHLGYRIAGFVDDAWDGLQLFHNSGYRLVADFANFPAFIRQHVADEVIVALPMESSYVRASHIVAWCEEQGITVRVLSDLFELRRARPRTEEFEDDAVITLPGASPDSWQHLCKRLLDVTLALAALTALLPLFLFTALLIKLTGGGPVFFVQKRVGFNKRRFRLYKFRTMVVDAERQLANVVHLNEANGPVFKIRNDPRITPLGKFLRKLSIDELPQLLNVLKGEMSLVGPRPLPWRDYRGFDQDWQRRRFSVRPGLTCLWQINGRSSVSFDKWMELDMQYIDQWSLWLDFKILARTVPVVLRGTGAV